MKLTIDDIVICLALLLGFSTSLVLLIANESWGTHFPPSIIAFFAAISVAALTYRFLGGANNAEFGLGVLRVTGSTAVLMGATWLLGDKIAEQSALFRTEGEYRPALERIKKEIATVRSENETLTNRVGDLQVNVAQLRAMKTGYSIDQVRKMRPDDDFVSDIRRMLANEDPPFRQTLKDIAARVTLNDAMVDTNVYRICTDTQDRLFSGLETQKDRLRMRRTFGEGEARVVDMVRGGTITPDGSVCPTSGRSFDIQITCADAVRLFPDRIERCVGLKPIYRSGVASIRGERVSLGALPPR
jgi:hypothetical protein